MALLACASATFTVHAEEPKPAETRDGATWLARVQLAAQRLSYVGNFIFQQGSQVQSSRITHLADATGEHEKLEILDGQPREYIRTNDDVRCYIPDSKLIISEKRTAEDRFPAVLSAPGTDIDTYYKVTKGAIERVAGRICQVILLEPRDALRYGYRLWTDQDTGLLLKAQTINENKMVIEQVAFTDVAIGGNIDRARLRPTAVSTDGWRLEKLDASPADLTGAGWTVRAPVPGFRKIREIRRAFGNHREVGQLVYSDGLAAISVFIESGAPPMPEGEASRGAINVVGRHYGDHWLTVVGEAPAASIRQVANSVELVKTK